MDFVELGDSASGPARKTGIEAAKSKGVYHGRKATAPVERVRQLHAEGMGPTAIAKETGLSRMHVYRLTKEATGPGASAEG